MQTSRAPLRRSFLPMGAVALSLLMGGLVAPAPVFAQALVATVNDDPITSYDLEQRMKLLRVLKKPATRDAALESLTSDRLRLREVKKYGIVPGNSEMGGAIAKVASEIKVPAQTLASQVQGAGIQESNWTDYFKAEAGWAIYVRAMNKTLEVSEQDVRAELKKKGGKAAVPNEFTMRQVVFIVPASAAPAALQTRAREAQQLRLRFTDCQSGLALARGLTDVAVKEQFSRSGNSLGAELRDVLEKTPVGHLPPPQRGPSGIEMVAVCAKRDVHDDAVAGEDIRQELLSKRLDTASAKLYAELRSRAVVVKR
jgi:peptidyl-prolyl cis-trans isomerase SurA